VSRLKLMANLDLAQRSIPQYGVILVTHEGKEYRVRLSTLPTAFGEKLVLEIRAENQPLLELPDLGWLPEQLAALQKVLERGRGLVLFAGPARSGVSTTLRACVGHLGGSARNVTLWDPESSIRLPGVNHAAISRLPLAAFLGLLPTQDPDLLGVTEPITADTAPELVALARSGCQVLAACRALDAVGALELLRGWGRGAELAHVVQAVVAQRLARRTCESCRGGGCAACHSLGYCGQVGMFEVLVLDDELRQAWMAGRLALEARFPRLSQVATRLPVRPEEVRRVLGH
ncbi:MAG: ATPase, T2SS/T4P/T4SS family, partial [Candidatus Eremiobacterota bacterium]